MSKTGSGLVKDAGLGAIICSILAVLINVLSNPKDFDSWEKTFAPLALGTIVGVLAGILYNLYKQLEKIYKEQDDTLTEMKKTLTEMKTELKDTLTQMKTVYEVFGKPFQMLMGDDTHSLTLKTLIQNSVVEKFNNIPYVNRDSYREFLEYAINESKEYRGINRETIGSFFKEHEIEMAESSIINNTGVKTRVQIYLETLGARMMKSKRRIFVVDDNDEAKMLNEFENKEMMDFYRQSNGNVDTYWITLNQLKKEYNLGSPNDCAIFDNKLILSYFKSDKILYFSMLDENNINLKVFSLLDQQLNCQLETPFKKVPL